MRRFDRRAELAARIALLLLIALGAAPARAATPAASIADAESAYVAGRFDEAGAAYDAILARAPKDTLALVRRGQLALYSNRLGEARTYLSRARDAGASLRRVSALLGEAAYREDDYPAAAPLIKASGQEARAAKLAAFGATKPWRITGPVADTIQMVQTDPLPLVEARVNGRGPYYFLIDTGGGELLLDPELADSIGVPRFGEEMGTFGGGRQRAVVHARLDRFEIGKTTIEGLPITLLDTKRFSGAALGRRVAGIVGTILLDHFRSTLDYPGGRLVLVRRESRGGPPEPAAPAGRIEVPFRMVGDHYMLAPGSVDSSGTVTWFVDTGLAGAAFTAPASTLKQAGIAVPDTSAGATGQGGGGAMKIALFPVKRLTLGGASATQVLGIFGPFPPSLERGHGIRVAGIVSHAFLRQWRLTFDFDRMRLLLDPPG